MRASILMGERPLTMSNHEPQEPPGRTEAPTHGIGFKIGAGVLTFLAAVACMGFSYWLRRPGPDLNPTVETPRTSLKLPANRNLFPNWGKPDLVIVLSGEEHGYLLPCGCSRPQKGGEERRYNFLQILRDKGWPVVALDLGDVAQAKPPADVLTNLQQIPKYKVAMSARKAMGYTAVGLGPIEANNLFPIYGAYPLQDTNPPVIAANLRNRDKEYPGGFVDWVETTPKGSTLKLGVTSIMGAYLTEHLPQGAPVKFDFGGDALKELNKKAAKVDFRVLLYQGYTHMGKSGKSEAVACAEMFPEYPVVVALSDPNNDEPSGTPIKVEHKKGGSSIVVTLGHKSKYVGVVGVFKTNNKSAPYDLRYQLVEMGEEYITPAAEEQDHPILKLMEDYTAELKNEDYLAKYAQKNHPLQVVHPGKKAPEYIGSEQCQGCHAGAYRVWEQTVEKHGDKYSHSKAYQKLVDAKRPANRQFDPECVVCHTVGFGYQTGFYDAVKTKELLNVGCESCHGPGGGHLAAEASGVNVKEWRQAINPWKYLPVDANKSADDQRKARFLKIEQQLCIKCHDDDNDVHWKGPDAFTEHWELIQHYTKKK
jgi:hypothetical protein